MLKIKLPEKFPCEESRNRPITENKVLHILLERDKKILELEQEVLELRNKIDSFQSSWLGRKIFKW